MKNPCNFNLCNQPSTTPFVQNLDLILPRPTQIATIPQAMRKDFDVTTYRYNQLSHFLNFVVKYWNRHFSFCCSANFLMSDAWNICSKLPSERYGLRHTRKQVILPDYSEHLQLNYHRHDIKYKIPIKKGSTLKTLKYRIPQPCLRNHLENRESILLNLFFFLTILKLRQ